MYLSLVLCPSSQARVLDLILQFCDLSSGPGPSPGRTVALRDSGHFSGFCLCSQSGGFATFGSSFSHKNVFCFCVCLVLVFVLSLFFFPSPFLHLRHFLGLMSYTFSTKSFSVNCKSFSLSDPLHPVLVLLQFQRFIFHLLPSVHFFSSNFEETWLWKVSRYCSASLKVHFISLELDFFSKMWELYKKKKNHHTTH